MGKVITITGLDKVMAGLGRYEKKVNKIIDTEAKRLVVSIAADGKRDVAVDTGFARANITTQVRRNRYSALSKATYSVPLDRRKPFFQNQAGKKIAKFIPKIKSIIRGL